MDENNFEVYFHNQVKEVVEYRKLNVDLYSDQFIIEYDRNKGLTIKKTDWQEYEKLKSTLLEKIPASKLTKGKNSRRVFWGLLSALFD